MITYSIFTNKGGRPDNEDYVAAKQIDGRYAFILADGLGGHGYGEVASKLVVDEGIRLLNEIEDIEHYLKYSFEIAQDKLLKYQKANRAVREMKTTKVNLCINKSDVMWGHIGDSRLYYFKGKRLIKRTLDHSYVQSLCRSKEIKETDIRNHPDRNVLLRVMGEDWNEPKYELSKKYRLKKNMSFLLCSDGFWELIDEKQMKMCLAKAQNVDEWIALMKNIIDENGKGKEMDNYSAIAVWVR